MNFRSVLGGLSLACLASGLLGGCSEDDKAVTVTSTAAYDNGQKMRLMGRILNAQTGAPVAATIEVCGITSGSTDGGGYFVIDLPGNIGKTGPHDSPVLGIRITAAGCATFLAAKSFDNDETGSSSGGEVDPGLATTSVINMGTVTLNTAFTQALLVTKDGTPLANARVYLAAQSMSLGWFNGIPDVAGICEESQSGTTDANGVLRLGGLDPFVTYTVVVPAQDLDGQTGFDFTTQYGTFTVQSSGATFALNVDGSNFFTSTVSVITDNASRLDSFSYARGVMANATNTVINIPPNTTTTADFSLAEVGDRLNAADRSGENTGNQLVQSADGSFSLVFLSPVHVVQGTPGREVHFKYWEEMTDPRTSATFNTEIAVTGTATQVANGLGCIWNFVPSKTLPLYTAYDLHFTAHSAADPSQAKALYWVGDADSGMLRIPASMPATIGVFADNYNGSQVTTATSQVYLDFDRFVVGSYRVIDKVDNNVSTDYEYDRDVWATDKYIGSLSVVNNIDTAPSSGTTGQLGTTSGIRFRIAIRTPNGVPVSLGDHTGAFTNRVRVAFILEDVYGNKLDTIKDLNIK